MWAYLGSTWAADFKPIELNPAYDHDKYITQPKDIVRVFRAYMTSFDSADDDNGDGKPDRWGIPEWVAYEIKRFPRQLAPGPRRPRSWITDKGLHAAGITPKDDTYRYSRQFRNTHPNWYVRGHLCMKQHAWRLGANADWNTHTVLNAVPQRKDFNSGIWLDLEKKTADWADSYGAVWIVTGPIIEEKTPLEWLGEEGEMRIAIPDALFKIVIKESQDSNRPDVLAFIYPQEGENYRRGPFDHAEYLTSVDGVEARTGLDFLTSLADDDEAVVERLIPTALWP